MQVPSHSHDCMTTFKESLLILLFEFIGTLLLTALFNSCYQALDASGLLCGFFILLIFSARISGSHFNPAITLAFMFRRDTGRFSRLLGLLYIAAQYSGAILGAIISYNLFQANGN
jgi:glycerol uptake facilitator-like aquaporin